MEDKVLWEKCIEFHGHSCGGLMIGYKAALLARELLNLNFSQDEELVCVSENDACGVDAIQVILGCSAGKGNLLFRMRGKQAFSFFNRTGDKAIRLVLKPRPKLPTKDESFKWLSDKAPSELFDVKTPSFPLPCPAKILNSLKCDACGEVTSENMLRLEAGKHLCLDCYKLYSRFDV